MTARIVSLQEKVSDWNYPACFLPALEIGIQAAFTTFTKIVMLSERPGAALVRFRSASAN
jgi:hypothetical protein